jgi:hypothetical protein
MQDLSVPKQHEVNIEISARSRVSIAGEARKAGKGRKRGWFHSFIVGTVPQDGHPGRFAFKDWVMKRVGFGNLCRETIIDEETGKKLRHCEEPLNEHTGHGSAKKQKVDTTGDAC